MPSCLIRQNADSMTVSDKPTVIPHITDSRDGYSEEDIFRGSDINQIFEEISKSFGFRGFEDVFESGSGSGYRTFEFGRGNIFGRGFVSSSGMKRGAPLKGPQKGVFPWLLRKLTGYALRKITGIQTQQEKDRYDQLMLTSIQAGQRR